ncbi:MAG: tRNA 2-thiouridine(34) synthase MnmA [Pirellulaceae bacterium]
MARVVLAMSGGVDSSVAAHLLLEQGHEPIGVFMRHGEESVEACDVTDQSPLLPLLKGRADHKQGCCSAEDAADARRVADHLQIPFYALNLKEDFRGIVDYFVEEYSLGRTPNPCVMCNNWIKFGRLFDYADSVKAEYVATGHYAQLDHRADGDLPALRRGVDDGKDQSYVLFGVQRALLDRILLPVGGYQKSAIRQLAEEQGLRVAGKRDSQEICFVTSGEHGDFVRQRRGGESLAGEIMTTAGKVVGQHEGIERFTSGQRRGLGVALGEPQYVVRIEPQSRRVVIGPHEDLARRQLLADRLNWLVDPPDGRFECLVQIRYNSSPQAADVEQNPDGQLQVTFVEPCFGVAPGQAVVLYDQDRVLGGGWIL